MSAAGGVDTDEVLVGARGLTVRLVSAPHRELLRGVDLEVRAGEVVGITGRSGAGKTVLAHGLAAAVPRPDLQTSGRLSYRGGPDVLSLGAEERRRIAAAEVGVVFQDPVGTLNPFQDVRRQLRDTIALRSPTGGAAPEGRQDAAQWLARVGLPDLARGPRRHPHQLSGGMCQRVAVALALCRGQRVVVADEPTSSLDPIAARELTGLLLDVVSERRGCLVLVGHDLALLSRVCTRLLVVDDGRIVADGPTGELLETPRCEVLRELVDRTRRTTLA